MSHFKFALPGEDEEDVGGVQHCEDEVEDEADKEELPHLPWLPFAKQFSTHRSFHSTIPNFSTFSLSPTVWILHSINQNTITVLFCGDLLPLQMEKTFTEWVLQQVVVPAIKNNLR